jgi:hypothetical protein
MEKRSGSRTMVGHFPNKKVDHMRRVEKWMSTCVQNGGIERYDELHIDRIDEAWRFPETWITASLEVLGLAASTRDSLGRPELSIAVGFSLLSADRRKGVDFATRGELQERFDRSPPSLYIFRRGKEPWTEPAADTVSIQKIESGIFGSTVRPIECFYLEFKQTWDEYYRSVFITA